MMTIDDMRDHIDKLIAELRVTRFPFEDDFHVYWIDDPEEAIAIIKPAFAAWPAALRRPAPSATLAQRLTLN